MKIQLIADSCCDVTPAMRATLNLKSAPLKITVEGKEYVDDGTVNIKQMLAAMKASKTAPQSAAPAPGDYTNLMREADACFVVTLSQQLSGSYNAAMAAKDIVLEESPDKQIVVLDSKSASAGELRIVLRLAELIGEGKSFAEIYAEIVPFISSVRTFFVLEDLSVLIKNGRIPKMTGMIGTVLMMRPIMGENGNGEVIPIEKVRGTQKALERLVAIVKEKTEKAMRRSTLLTLSHCNCADRAAELKKHILQTCHAISDVILAPTSGLSTCYANDGGIVLAFSEQGI